MKPKPPKSYKKLLVAVALFKYFTSLQRSPREFKSAARCFPLWLHLYSVQESGWTTESIATTWQNFALSTDPQPTTSHCYYKVWQFRVWHVKALAHEFNTVFDFQDDTVCSFPRDRMVFKYKIYSIFPLYSVEGYHLEAGLLFPSML